MTGARTEKAIALEQADNTWACQCGHVNTLSSFELNEGGKVPCKKAGCDVITEL